MPESVQSGMDPCLAASLRLHRALEGLAKEIEATGNVSAAPLYRLPVDDFLEAMIGRKNAPRIIFHRDV